MLQNVWVFKNSRNDNHEIAQKPKELTKVRDHVYFYTEDTDYGTWTHTDFFLVMENKGVFVLVGLVGEKTIREEVTWESYLQQVESIIEGQRYLNNLDLKLLETVSTDLYRRALASREADIHRREEETQKRLAREREERERKEAEKKARQEEVERICNSLKGILKDNLSPLQKSLAASYLMEVGNFRFEGNTVRCTYYNLITVHGFNQPDVWLQEYNRDGSLKVKPVSHYSITKPIKGTSRATAFDISGRLGALMVQQN